MLGEHGTSQVYLWSSARVAGRPIEQTGDFRSAVEDEVRYANISIIEGTGASQLGIGVATARIVEIITRDERVALPIGSYHRQYGATLSLPSILGAAGVREVVVPPLAEDEARALEKSAATLRGALKSIRASFDRRSEAVGGLGKGQKP